MRKGHCPYGSKGPGWILCRKLVDKIGMGKLGGPLGGREPRVPISRGKKKLLIGTISPRPPWGVFRLRS